MQLFFFFFFDYHQHPEPTFKMAGEAAPKILTIADLQEAASAKLPKATKGNMETWAASIEFYH